MTSRPGPWSRILTAPNALARALVRALRPRSGPLPIPRHTAFRRNPWGSGHL